MKAVAQPIPNIRKLNHHKPLHQSIAKIAERVERLIPADASSKRRQELASTLDLFLGAIHAVFLASDCGFKERRRTPIEIKVLKARAAQLKACELRTDGVWMAGFHLNSALTRLAATYHRVLKMVVRPANGEDDRVHALRPRAVTLYRQKTGTRWRHDWADKVHNEVNQLKHAEAGLYGGRGVALRDAVKSAAEIVTLLEAL